MQRVLITGATGFIGSALMAHLSSRNDFEVRGAVRVLPADGATARLIPVGDIDGSTAWADALAGCDAVVHLAGRAHRVRESYDPHTRQHESVNFHGTLQLGREAARSGVRRLVFVSTIGVNGTRTLAEHPFDERQTPMPGSGYAASKWAAEQGLSGLARETGMEVVIVRPPLVYGSGAPGNFATLIRVLRSGVPLPLASVHNQRSFIGIDNLVDALACCVSHPSAAGQTFLLSDGSDISTPQLLRSMAYHMGVPQRLFPCPIKLVELAAMAVGRRRMAESLCASLQVDARKMRTLLGWQPPVSLDEGIRRAVASFRVPA